MADPLTIKIEGLADLEHRLQEMVPKAARKKIREALTDGANEVLKEMQAEVPHDTGWLRDHLTFKITVGSRLLAGRARIGPTGTRGGLHPDSKPGYVSIGRKKFWAEGKTADVIARFLEFGTVKMHPNAFMSKAYHLARNKALDRMITKLREIVSESAH